MSEGEAVEATAEKGAASLEKLPLHLLENICEYLAEPDPLRQDLASLSLVSTLCAAGATRFRLRRLHLRISGPKKLLEDLHCMSNEQSRYLRQIKLSGSMLGARNELRRRSSRSTISMTRDDDNVLDDFGDFCRLPRSPEDTPLFDPFSVPLDEPTKHQLNESWRPLADFISKLTSLTDLVYACAEQIPRCLLDVLHQNSPETRLHMHTFSLRSLYHQDYVHNLDPDEYKLATSPSLHSVASIYHETDGRGNPGHNKAALKSMVAGLAPNLRSLAIWCRPPKRYSRPVQRVQWTGFLGNESPHVNQSSQGNLETLICDPYEVREWVRLTRPEALVDLIITGDSGDDDVEFLSEISQDVGFEKLRSLRLYLETQAGNDGYETINEDAVSLLLSLPPLQTLDLGGALDETTFTAVLNGHGRSLENLKLMPDYIYFADEPPEKLEISVYHTRELVRTCRKLNRLKLLVCRTEGDVNEAAIYRNLGRIRSLKLVELTLDCFSSHILDPGDEIHGEIIKMYETAMPASVLREMLVNSAIDSMLAEDIFDLIDDEKNTLEYLKIKPRGLGGLWPGEVDDASQTALNWIGRSWVCTRPQQREPIVIRSIHDERRGSGGLLEEDFEGCDDLRKIWMDIWPGEAGDRRDKWFSLPLDEKNRKSS